MSKEIQKQSKRIPRIVNEVLTRLNTDEFYYQCTPSLFVPNPSETTRELFCNGPFFIEVRKRWSRLSQLQRKVFNSLTSVCPVFIVRVFPTNEGIKLRIYRYKSGETFVRELKYDDRPLNERFPYFNV